MVDKQDQRTARRAARAALPSDRIAAESSALVAATEWLIRRAGPGGIAGFQPTNREPDISLLLNTVAGSIPVLVPAVSGDALVWVRPPSPIRGQAHGIPRPDGPVVARGSELVALGVGVILVPALAIDPDTGLRLGYGGGYYDRLIADLRGKGIGPDRVLLIGVCRDDELLPLTTEPHDQPVDGVLTPSGVRLFDRSG